MSSSNLLIIGFVWPEPKSSAAGSRMLQLIDQFLAQGYKITFACAANTSDNTFDLSQLGVQTQTIALNDAFFDSFITRLNPDVVLFDRFMIEEQYGWRVAEHCPNALRILDTEDLHGLRKARAQALKANETFEYKHLLNDFTKREIASIYRCDLSLIISEFEMNLLTQQFKIDPKFLLYLPFLLDTISDTTKAQIPTYEHRSNFMIIGNFLHKPNTDAILHLKKSIWPVIRKALPKSEVHIYGAYSSEKSLQLHNEDEGFIVKGGVEEVDPIMKNYKVCLAPLRYGAGLKGKVFDAIKNGTPCMMSQIAAEGIFKIKDASFLIENDPIEFANKAVALYTNSNTWAKARQKGFEILRTKFDKQLFELNFKEQLNHIKSNRVSHRESNIIGQVLSHQSMKSTKYMSKWIEEKNKAN